MRSEEDIERCIDTHGNTVWRVCVLYFSRSADAQDAFQETMIKYAQSTQDFNGEEHKKAWLIRVVSNECKDMLKASYRKNISLDDESGNKLASKVSDDSNPDETLRDVLKAIRDLKEPLRTSVYLALYEGYTAPEIATLLDAPVNTVYSWIARGKQQLREVLL